LYNSIEDLLKIGNIFAHSTDVEFKNISVILKNDILCNYRIILNNYSEAWLSINEISGIKTRKDSLSYDSSSVIITRLLLKWITHIGNFVVNIERKLF
jgi:hypothetical protein